MLLLFVWQNAPLGIKHKRGADGKKPHPTLQSESLEKLISSVLALLPNDLMFWMLFHKSHLGALYLRQGEGIGS